MLDAVVVGEVALPFLLSAREMVRAHADQAATIAQEVASLVRTADGLQAILRLTQSAGHALSLNVPSFFIPDLSSFRHFS